MLSADEARRYFKAVIENVADFVDDAAVLAVRSARHAHGLLVLAQEELGKAVWISEVFAADWAVGENNERDFNPGSPRGHLTKYMVMYEHTELNSAVRAAQYMRPESAELPDSYLNRVKAEAARAASEAHESQLKAFYVDLPLPEWDDYSVPPQFETRAALDGVAALAHGITHLLDDVPATLSTDEESVYSRMALLAGRAAIDAN